MPRQKLHRPAALFARTLLGALAAAAACGARADDPNPYYLGVSASLAHDSNVYRVPDRVPILTGGTRADTYWGAGLVGGFDQAYGRQRFYADANVRNNNYVNNKDLDNVSYGLNAGWDWATIDRLSGGVNVSANQSLATQDNNNTNLPTFARNVVNTEQLAARVRWGGDGALNLDGAYSHSHVGYSLATSTDSSQDSASVGASYRVGPTLRLGAGLRFSRTTESNASDSSNGTNLDLSADWRATAQSGLNARLSYTRQTNAGSGGTEFSGLTGALTGTYAPTSKLAFNATVSHDAGSNSTFYNLANSNTGQSVTSLSQNTQTTTAYLFGASYAATAKIGVTAGVQYRHNKVDDRVNLQNTPGDTHDDNTFTASLGTNYAIARNWSLACSLAYMKRDVSGLVPYAYNANTVSCSTQYTLR
jgi:hypothetical protein